MRKVAASVFFSTLYAVKLLVYFLYRAITFFTLNSYQLIAHFFYLKDKQSSENKYYKFTEESILLCKLPSLVVSMECGFLP